VDPRRIKRFVRRARGRAVQPIMHGILRPRRGVDLVRLGSSYGGWWVPLAVLKNPGVAYCAGAGEDVTFDLELAGRGFDVWTFDPTPRAIEHVRKVGRDLHFLAIGWWGSTTTLRFFAPAKSGDVSHSAVNLQDTTEYFDAPVTTVNDLARQNGHPRIDLIKMDIEGAEYEVIASLLSGGPLPGVWCVEFDQPQPMRKVLRAIARIRRQGYDLVKIERWNYTFMRADHVG
jgi:FkbM family methyltransferase